MSFQFTAGRFKGWASDNTPLAGGRLYTYASGTTTQKNVYTDATLGTVCTYVSDGVGGLYIALDSKGEAQLWLGSGAYTFKLTDSLGATVWTVDGVQDPSDSTKTELSSTSDASKGAGMVGRPDPVLNYVASTIGALLNEVCVSIMGFEGADPTGATSSDAAFSAAAALVGTESGGYTLLIPKGTFVISNWNLSGKKGLRIQGVAGDDYAVIKVAGKITCNNTGYFKCTGVRFVGDIFNTTTRALVGSPTAGNILFDMVDNCAAWDVAGNRFEGFDTVFRPNAGAVNGSYIVNIERNYFGWNNTSILADGILHWWITHNTFSEDRVCNVWIKTGGAFHVDSNSTENSANSLSSGFNFRYGDGVNAVVANGSCDRNTAHQWYGVQLQKISQMSVNGNKGRIAKGPKAFEIINSCNMISVAGNIVYGYDGSTYHAYGVYVKDNVGPVNVQDNNLLDFDCVLYFNNPAGGASATENSLRGAAYSIDATGITTEDLLVTKDNQILGGTIRSSGNSAAWVAGPNYSRASTVLTNTDGYADISGTYGGKIYRSAGTQAIAASSGTHVSYDTTDWAHGLTASIGNAPVSPDKLTVTQPGRFRIVARLKLDSVAAGKYGYMLVRKNNSVDLARVDADADVNGNVYLQFEDVFSLAKTDYINLVVFHNDTVSRNVSVASLCAVMI